MQIEVLKSELSGALSALVEVGLQNGSGGTFRSLRIESKDGIYSIYTSIFTVYPHRHGKYPLLGSLNVDRRAYISITCRRE